MMRKALLEDQLYLRALIGIHHDSYGAGPGTPLV